MSTSYDNRVSSLIASIEFLNEQVQNTLNAINRRYEVDVRACRADYIDRVKAIYHENNIVHPILQMMDEGCRFIREKDGVFELTQSDKEPVYFSDGSTDEYRRNLYEQMEFALDIWLRVSDENGLVIRR